MMYYDDFTRFLQITFWVIIGFMLLWAALTLVEYVLSAIAVSRMARNAGHPSPFLAWIPIAGDYLLGSLCDRSQTAFTGKCWKFSVILPVIDALALLGGGSLAGLLTASLASFGGPPNELVESGLLSMGSNLLSLASAVAMGFALYQLFRDYAPGREVLYTVLAVILGGLGRAILLMTIRDKIPLSAQSQGWGGGWAPPGGYPPQGGPYQAPPPYYGPQGPAPWQSGPGTAGWGQPPTQGNPGTTGWNPPPAQGSPGAAGWSQPPYENGPGTTGWNQPPAQGNPGTAGWSQPPAQDRPKAAGEEPTASSPPPEGPNPEQQ